MRLGVSSERSRGFGSGSGSTANTNVEKFDRVTGSSSQGLEERSSTGLTDRISMGRDRSAGTLDQVTGGINGGIGGGGGRKGGGGRAGGGGLLPNVGGSLGVSKTGQQVDNLRSGTDQTRSSDSSSSSSSGVRDEHSNGSGASTSDGTYVRSGSFSRSSVTSSSSVSTEDALSRARSYSGPRGVWKSYRNPSRAMRASPNRTGCSSARI